MPTYRHILNSALAALIFFSPTLHALTQPGDSPDDIRRKRAQRQLQENRRVQERIAEDITPADLPPMDPALVTQYTQMLQTIAAPEMEGRVPGSQGIEKAAQYIETHLRDLGLRPAFQKDITELNGVKSTNEADAEGQRTEDSWYTYRQPMQMGTHTTATSVNLSFADTAYSSFDQVSPLAYSGSATVTAPVVFAGYAIVSGPNNYLGFETNETIQDKIVIVLNYEPMNPDGSSQWREEGWSHNSRLTYKVTALDRRGAAGVIIVNPPNAIDERAQVLESVESTAPPSVRVGDRAGPQYDIPVVHTTPAVAQSILTYLGSDADLAALTEQANAAGIIKPLGDPNENKQLTLAVQLQRTPRMTDNIGAILPGQGALANEFVVIGSHYDHVGFGKFGSRIASNSGKLHPGADDNASGTTANLIAAQLLKQRYQLLADDQPARSILFLWFTAEESGLNGSKFYVGNPIAPLDQHHIMLNMDMVGTLSDGLLEIGGFDSGEGFEELATPALKASGITYSEDVSVGSGRSDHASFDNAGIPALFFFTGLHDRYHAPEDIPDPDLLDMEGAVRIAALVSDMAFDAATKPQDIPHPSNKQAKDDSGAPKVRVGIIPSNSTKGGMRIERVFEDTSASQAGLRPGDRITAWNGTEIDSVETWMPILANHKPGDKVALTVIRADETLELGMTLRGIE